MTDTVKSAKRTLGVFELFEERRSPASTAEIAAALEIPVSSASVLLRTMTTEGYLYYDSSRRTYVPTPRVALLGGWLSQPLFKQRRLINLMDHLAQETGETIMLGVRNGLTAQYAHVIQATLPARLYVKSGTLRPLTRSALGFAILSRFSNAEVRRIVSRVERLQPDGISKTPIKELLPILETTRKRGYSDSINLVTPGAGAIAVNLPTLSGELQPLTICVAGLSESLVKNADNVARMTIKAVSFFMSE